MRMGASPESSASSILQPRFASMEELESFLENGGTLLLPWTPPPTEQSAQPEPIRPNTHTDLGVSVYNTLGDANLPTSDITPVMTPLNWTPPSHRN